MVVVVFFMIVTDDDRQLVEVIGPVEDDTDCTDAVVQLQKSGRQVRCHRPPDGISRTELVESCKRQFGYSEAEEPIL